MSAQINIPSAPLSDEEAKAHVAAVCPALAGLTPGAPGMSCETWQELATLAGPAPTEEEISIAEWLKQFQQFEGEAVQRRADKQAAKRAVKHAAIAAATEAAGRELSWREEIDVSLKADTGEEKDDDEGPLKGWLREQNEAKHPPPKSPDIRWLGTVLEVGGYTNDYTDPDIHPHRTDLRFPGHRDRFGEKALKFGGIDFALRALDCFPVDMRVGYHGVLSLFQSAAGVPSSPRPPHLITHARQRSSSLRLAGGPEELLRELPKVQFFLHNWSTLVAPRLAANQPEHATPRTPTPQAVANSLLSQTISCGDPDNPTTMRALEACRATLGAQLVAPGCTDEHEAGEFLGHTGGGWAELLGHGDVSMLKMLHAILQHGPTFPAHARDESCAKNVLQKSAWADWDSLDFSVQPARQKPLRQQSSQRQEFRESSLLTRPPRRAIRRWVTSAGCPSAASPSPCPASK
tara:strand:+ start:55 stop:1440 length:1386 start_codon:yes stop_codon:yes gene_type:complete